MTRLASFLQRWPLIVATIFCVSSIVLVWQISSTQALLRASSEARSLADSERRGRIIMDFLDMHTKTAEEIAQGHQVEAYLTNRALGMSERYGLAANLGLIVDQARGETTKKLFRGAPVFRQIGFHDITGLPLAQTVRSGKALPLPAIGVEETALIVDETAQELLAVAPVFHKNELKGSVLTTGPVALLSALLLADNGGNALYQELLVSDQGLCIMAPKAPVKVDRILAKLFAGLAADRFTDLASLSGAPSQLESSMALRTPIANTPLSLITLIDKDEVHEKRHSRIYLISFATFPMLLLLTTLAMERLQRSSARLQSDNIALTAEIRRRSELERSLRDKGRELEDLTSELLEASRVAETSRAQLRGITDSANDAILMMDANGKVSFWNPAAERIFGYAREAALGGSLRTLLAPQDTRPDAEEALLEFVAGSRDRAGGKTIELLARRKDGGEIPVSLSMSAVELDGQWHAVGILRDVSELKKTQEQLLLLNRSLRRQVEEAVAELRAKDQVLIAQGRQAAMGEMIGNIAHQWRQPLNALTMLLTNLQFAFEDDELTAEYMHEAVDTASHLIQKMSSTINDFRDFFKPDKEKRAFSAMTQVKMAVGMIGVTYRHNAITIAIDGSGDCLLWGYANEFSQVLLNLFNNARDAIIASGRVNGRIEVGLGALDGMGRVTVTDNGGGIDDEVVGKIFEPYFSTKKTGTGIGLYMSKVIIENNMGGRIEVTRRPGATLFTVTVPLASAITPGPALKETGESRAITIPGETAEVRS